MKNQIPKSYFDFDIYNNLVPNNDDSQPYYQQIPRVGAFEVSYKGVLLFSKLKSGNWPIVKQVAAKCAFIVRESSETSQIQYGEFSMT